MTYYDKNSPYYQSKMDYMGDRVGAEQNATQSGTPLSYNTVRQQPYDTQIPSYQTPQPAIGMDKLSDPDYLRRMQYTTPVQGQELDARSALSSDLASLGQTQGPYSLGQAPNPYTPSMAPQQPAYTTQQRPLRPYRPPQQSAFGRGQRYNRQMPSQFANRNGMGLRQLPQRQQMKKKLERLRMMNPRLYNMMMMRMQQTGRQGY